MMNLMMIVLCNVVWMYGESTVKPLISRTCDKFPTSPMSQLWLGPEFYSHFYNVISTLLSRNLCYVASRTYFRAITEENLS